MVPTLYLNENMAIVLVRELSSLGLRALHTIPEGNSGREDEYQLLYATKRNYILVTHNRRHFRQLHRNWLSAGKRHAGILVLGTGEPSCLARRIKIFFETIYPTLLLPFCEVPPMVA